MNSFDQLLAALNADRDRAGAAYEELRARLVKFLAWEGCRDPEQWADETMSRVARKIAEGEAVMNVPAYAAGVARLVLKEALRQQQRLVPLETDVAASVTDSLEDSEFRAKALRRCLAELPEEARQLILDYYHGDGAVRIRQRQRMADGLGISLNSLRNRALRLRDRLEKCLGSRDVSPAAHTSEKGGDQ